jgi:hypothetical protein
MNHKELGMRLKQSANAGGNFVLVNIDNMYNLLEVLSYFFYKKHHEWAAICFINQNFVCNKIWFNKGPDHTTVSLGLSPEEIIEFGIKFKSKYIVVAHNHPASNKMLPNYKTRFENIQANKRLQKEIFDFSDQDIKSAHYYQAYLHENQLGSAEAVFVAGSYKISGDETIVNNFTENKKVNIGCGCLTPAIVLAILFIIITIIF